MVNVKNYIPADVQVSLCCTELTPPTLPSADASHISHENSGFEYVTNEFRGYPILTWNLKTSVYKWLAIN